MTNISIQNGVLGSVLRNIIGICALIFCINASAKPELTKNEYENLFMATFSYMTVIKACNLKNLYNASDAALNKTIRYGYENRLHSTDTERISQNINFYTATGIDAYKNSPKVNCADAANYMQTIIQVVKQLQ